MIGKNCIIKDRVTLCENTIIGDNTVLETGVVVSQDIKNIREAEIKKTIIGNNVLIDAKAIIVAGSQIVDNSEIARSAYIDLREG